MALATTALTKTGITVPLPDAVPDDEPVKTHTGEGEEPPAGEGEEPPAGEGEAVVVREPGLMPGPYPRVELVLIAGIDHVATAFAHDPDTLTSDTFDIDPDATARHLLQRFGARLPRDADSPEPAEPPDPPGPPDPAPTPPPGPGSHGSGDLAWLGRALSPYGVPARVEHAGPVDAATLELLACNAVIRTAVLAPNGALLDLGRTQRLASAAQKTALTARDGGCVIPGCTAPADACDAHHIIWWSRGGPTDIDNLTLACGRHHDEIHHGTWQIQIKNGVPWATPPRWIDPRGTPLRNAVHHPRTRQETP
jgi:hypothetical protein